MKIVSFVGARPQFIKCAVVSRAIANLDGGTIVEDIIHTGQHYDANMSDVFFAELDIPKPAVNLEIVGGKHGQATGRMLELCEREIEARQPDLVLVYGDTNSTLAGALAAAKLNIPIAHVEAGLRSYNRRMPEEINRVLTDHVSTLLFVPSVTAKDNLAREGITSGVHMVGDVMYDAVLYYRGRITSNDKEPYAVLTVHRAENTDDPARLAGILRGIATAELPVRWPIHPRTRNALVTHGLEAPQNVEFCEPVSYLEMIAMVSGASFVLTDSGGLQKEAYFLGKRCVTLRDETEWTELVETGVNRLTGADPLEITAAINWAATGQVPATELYGDGNAGRRIAEMLGSVI